MKKILCIALVLLMILNFIGCKSSGDVNENGESVGDNNQLSKTSDTITTMPKDLQTPTEQPTAKKIKLDAKNYSEYFKLNFETISITQTPYNGTYNGTEEDYEYFFTQVIKVSIVPLKSEMIFNDVVILIYDDPWLGQDIGRWDIGNSDGLEYSLNSDGSNSMTFIATYKSSIGQKIPQFPCNIRIESGTLTMPKKTV